MTGRTVSLEVAAEIICGTAEDAGMKDPVRWLSDQIRAKRFVARKVGRQWRMTFQDIDHALDLCANTNRNTKTREQRPNEAAPATVRQLTFTPTSQRRRSMPA